MTTIVTLLAGGAVGSIIVTLISALFNRRKISAEAAQLISQAGAGIAVTVEGFVRSLSAENAELKKENYDLKVQVQVLMEEVRLLRRELNEVRVDTKATRASVERAERDRNDG